MPWTAAGVGEAAAGASRTVATTLVGEKGRAVIRTMLGPPVAGAAASEGGASALTGFDRQTWGRNRSPPLVLTMFPTKEGENGWREKLEKMEVG